LRCAQCNELFCNDFSTRCFHTVTLISNKKKILGKSIKKMVDSFTFYKTSFCTCTSLFPITFFVFVARRKKKNRWNLYLQTALVKTTSKFKPLFYSVKHQTKILMNRFGKCIFNYLLYFDYGTALWQPTKSTTINAPNSWT